jgi:hypothetical protein
MIVITGATGRTGGAASELIGEWRKDPRRFAGVSAFGDALGVVAAVGTDAVIDAVCGECAEPMSLEIEKGKLRRSEVIIHPAHHW